MHPYYFILSFQRGAWCARDQDNLQWIQITFDTPIKAMAIQTQGAEHPEERWIKTYQISYSVDGFAWSLYKDKEGQDKVRNLKYSKIIHINANKFKLLIHLYTKTSFVSFIPDIVCRKREGIGYHYKYS